MDDLQLWWPLNTASLACEKGPLLPVISSTWFILATIQCNISNNISRICHLVVKTSLSSFITFGWEMGKQCKWYKWIITSITSPPVTSPPVLSIGTPSSLFMIKQCRISIPNHIWHVCGLQMNWIVSVSTSDSWQTSFNHKRVFPVIQMLLVTQKWIKYERVVLLFK